MAQNTVKGKVMSNADNQPVVGATVQLEGTQIGTTTDAEGNYSLPISGERTGTLHFSFLGYTSISMAIDNKSIVNVSLQPAASELDELVVTGYTKQKKADLTGSVEIVNIDNMTKQPSGQVALQLQGQASGVTVISSGQPGDAPQIRIRGINTFGNNTPLFVVDGVPTQNISDLNPNDVASIQVLKDAGAASIYGSRASNGVIIITTKVGKDKVTVHYDAYYGTQIPRGGNIFDVMNPQENADLKWLALKNSGTPIHDDLYGSGNTPVLPDYISPVGAKEGDPSVDPSKYYVNPDFTSVDDFNTFHQITRANKAGTDWFHEVFKPAPVTSHNLSVSGGGDKGNYFFSMNYFNQQGMMIQTQSKRYSIRSNSRFNVTKNISIGENLEYSISNNRQIPSHDDRNNSVFNAAVMQPIIPVYDIGGNYGGDYGTDIWGDNPVAQQFRKRNNRNINNRLLGNIYADITFLHDFTFHTSFGGENYSGNSHSFSYPVYESYLPTSINSYTEGSTSGYNWTWTNTLAFHKQFNNVHDLNVLIGTEGFDAEGESVGGTTNGYFSFDPNFTTLSSGSGTVTNYSTKSSEGLFSEFGRLDYSYSGKYLLSATIRRDGSSKFINEQYGWFPAVSGGWRISQENFMKGITWITDLKIRGGWGVMGNQLNVNATNGYYTFVSNKNSSYYDLSGSNNSIQQGFQVGQIGNPDAKWEKDINSNIGLDASLFDGKVEFTADYYYKNIKDLLYNPNLLGTAGSGAPPFINIARVKNSGFDLSLSGHTNITHDLLLDASVTLTTYHNEVLKVTGNTDYFWTDDKRRFGTDFIRNEVGHPIGAYYGYKIAGFWNSADEIKQADKQAQKATGDPAAIYEADEGVGRFRYADINNDGQINTDDRTFLGNPNPKFSYGLNLGLTYKGFDFSLFLYGVYGNQVWNQLKWWLDFYPSFNTAKSSTALYDSWTPDHQNAKVAIQENNGFSSTNGSPNSYYVENGSYLRAKNLQLGYTFPSALLKNVGIEKLRIYVQTANLFTITKYSGPDPEISGSPTDFGVDEGNYPFQREFLLGVNLNF